VLYKVAAGWMVFYGIISLVGGYLGYANKGSVASLVAGSAIGVLIILCAAGVFYRPTWGLAGAIVIAIAVLGRFGRSFFQNVGVLGEFVQTTIGIITVLMVVGALLVIILSALCLGMGNSA
jgi:uncharacterized membrane protein (UPF0136 family)